MKYKYVIASEIGQREKNEDNFYIDGKYNKWGIEKIYTSGTIDGNFVCAILDGLGGLSNGEKASGIMAELLCNASNNTDIYYDEKKLANLYIRADLGVNELKNSVGKCGTTCTSIIIKDNKIKVLHIGDCRAYFINNDEIRRLTIDQTLAAMKIRIGIYEENDPEEFAERNQLLDFIGKDRLGEVIPKESDWVEWADEDILFLCTDGLYDVCIDEDIHHIVKKYNSIEQSMNALSHYVKGAGMTDNMTYIIIQKVL